METTSIAWLEGQRIHDVRRDDETDEWVFILDQDVAIRVAGPWRIMAKGRIALGSCDHRQQFGLPQPVDGQREGLSLLAQSPIARAGVTPVCADLLLEFADGTCLEILNPSSGYEGWNLTGRGHTIVALGGGRVTEWGPNAYPRAQADRHRSAFALQWPTA
jgi:hypothetical protein